MLVFNSIRSASIRRDGGTVGGRLVGFGEVGWPPFQQGRPTRVYRTGTQRFQRFFLRGLSGRVDYPGPRERIAILEHLHPVVAVHGRVGVLQLSQWMLIRLRNRWERRCIER